MTFLILFFILPYTIAFCCLRTQANPSARFHQGRPTTIGLFCEAKRHSRADSPYTEYSSTAKFQSTECYSTPVLEYLRYSTVLGEDDVYLLVIGPQDNASRITRHASCITHAWHLVLGYDSTVYNNGYKTVPPQQH